MSAARDVGGTNAYRVTVSCACGAAFASKTFAECVDGDHQVLPREQATAMVCPQCNRRHLVEVLMVMTLEPLKANGPADAPAGPSNGGEL